MTVRPESGAIRFVGSGDTGVFVRGEEATFYSRVIDIIRRKYRDYPLDLEMTQLESLGHILRMGEKAPISGHVFVKVVDYGVPSD